MLSTGDPTPNYRANMQEFYSLEVTGGGRQRETKLSLPLNIVRLS